MDNNYLFLKMQTGGQLSPEQLQRAQQMGQLPQMNMGAGLTDIQKMNMAEDQHYGMFRRGGVPMRYAQGGEQEEIDQQYMSPYTQYNQRVSEFLENLKATAMSALQEEMVGVNDEYADEADQIEMEEAQYGRQVSSPTLNPQGMNAVNAWMGAAQNTKDLTTPLAQTAGLASGLKGYFGGDQASYEANPYNSAWNPTRLTVTNKDNGQKTVTRARRDGFFQPGGENQAESAFDENGNFKPGYKMETRSGSWGSPRQVIIGPDGNEFTEPTVSNTGDPTYDTVFQGTPRPITGTPYTPFGGAGIAGQAAGLVRTGKFISDNLPASTAASTEVGPFTGNVGAPIAAAAEQIPNTVTPNWYSAVMQGGKSQMATGQAYDDYGDKARADEAAYNAQQAAAQTQKTEIEQNAIRMGWVNPDGTADVAGYSAPGADGKSWGYKPGFDPNAATNAALPTTTKKKETGPKGGGSKGTGSAGSGSGSGAGATTTGTTTTPPTGTEVVKNADGSESSISPEEAAKRKAEADKKAKEEGKTTTATTTTTPKTGTGEIDYLASLADPTGQNAGGVYRTDRNGNPVPMAFYDPNMRLTGMSADYRNNAASWFRKNKKPGQMKSLSFDFTTGTQSPATQVPSITGGPNPNAPAGTQVVTNPDGTQSSISPDEVARREQITSGRPTGTTVITNPDGTQSSVAPNFYEKNFPAAPATQWDPSKYVPKYNPTSTTTYPGGPFPAGNTNDNAYIDDAWKQTAANWKPGMTYNGPQEFLPTSIRGNQASAPGPLQVAQNAPLTAAQQEKINKIQARTQRKVSNIEGSAQQQRDAGIGQGQGFQAGQRISYDNGSDNNPNVKVLSQPGQGTPGQPVQGPDGNWITFDSQGNPYKSMDREVSRKMASGKRYGGILNKAQVGVEVSPANQGYDMGWAPIGQEKRAPEDRVNPNVQMSQDFNIQKYGEPIMTNTEDNYTAKYDKNKKDNPFFAPAMLAGLNLVAGATQNADAKKKENELRGKLSYDQIYSANPETSGSRGDWTFNEGYMRPNDMVPTQFTGNGRQMQWGGAYSEGDELYLDEDAIQAFLEAGGQLDYLD
jgi:hypothetical protein